MRPVVWSEAAIADLETQVAYIAADNHRAALRVRNRIAEVGRRLSQFATGRRGRVPGTYEQVVPRLPYLVIYRIRRTQGSEWVSILRVIHTSRNWPG
jgi:plasmid stabilization system protein ParE